MIAFLLLVLFFFSPAQAQAPDFQVRAPLHATQEYVAFWVVEPNILDNQHQVWTVIGPRYQADKWWVEVMGGGMLQSENPFPIVDVRASWQATDWLHFWAETAWAQGFYYFAQVDTPVWIGKLGVEIEQNQFGPHVIVPFSDHFTLITAYHVTNDVFRCYVIFDF